MFVVMPRPHHWRSGDGTGNREFVVAAECYKRHLELTTDAGFGANRSRPEHAGRASRQTEGSLQAVARDRGMITSARIEEDLKPAGLDWITALRAPAIRKLGEDGGPRQMSLFDDRDMG
jgi:hypothetical protein